MRAARLQWSLGTARRVSSSNTYGVVSVTLDSRLRGNDEHGELRTVRRRFALLALAHKTSNLLRRGAPQFPDLADFAPMLAPVFV